eukprot:CAMPEP_0205822042 /NCGR_PEP_ID=MMETSP0206-20130828/10824_1 /ASSEMBLY_ACC=CAM_ASM_000279 /TAXON_ID=36767 /ORGANISM="Euplotes focardii, Strain TN1" /LENGTH=268 /DNA_ID=CAMNT_0053117983 /DNA_START=129 /DNA_END=935 /DNA_ORIENTATION=-
MAWNDEVMSKIEQYQSCQELARKAMSNATYENELEAFQGLLESVAATATFFEQAKALEQTVPSLLLQIASPPAGEDDEKSAVIAQQALAKQLAQILDFGLRFDQVRMMRPHLSNDFSYYRRLLPKFNKHPDVRVKDDEASGMALFTAEHAPMTSCLSKAALKALDKNEHVCLTLAILANSCARMVRLKKCKPETNLFAVHAMTGAVVIYDNVHMFGAFHKKSPINIKGCVSLLKREFSKEEANPLLNAIRYSTKHFKDAPESLQNMFD